MFWAHHHFSILYMFFEGSPLSPHHTFFLLFFFICLFGFGRLATYSLVRSLVRLQICSMSERSFIWLTFIDDSGDITVVRCWNICVYTVLHLAKMNETIVCASELTTAIMNFVYACARVNVICRECCVRACVRVWKQDRIGIAINLWVLVVDSRWTTTTTTTLFEIII